MSGHSKWSQIKRQKGVADIKRGQAFTKITSAITIAVRDGGGITDPEQNFKLRLAIEKARSINMPKENIQRAIDRGAGKGGSVELQNVLYEGFFAGNVAVIVDAVTDNKQRTTAQIKNLFEKNGASLGVPGAVSYLFQTKGLITVRKNNQVTAEELFLFAADHGAEDIEEGNDKFFIYTKPEELTKIKDALSSKVTIESSELIRKPIMTQTVKDPQAIEKLITFVNKLELLDDVQKVYSNFHIPDTAS